MLLAFFHVGTYSRHPASSWHDDAYVFDACALSQNSKIEITLIWLVSSNDGVLDFVNLKYKKNNNNNNNSNWLVSNRFNNKIDDDYKTFTRRFDALKLHFQEL